MADVIKNCRLHEASFAVDFNLFTTRYKPRSLFASLNIFHHTFGLLAINNRAHFGCGIERITRLHCLCNLSQLLNKRVFNGSFDIEPRIRRTDLSLIKEGSKRCHVRCRIKVFTVCKHKVGAFAPRFWPDLFQV